ncbi:hypothetical protein ACFX2I_024162 [Malus domestica]
MRVCERTILDFSAAEFEQWCITDEQTPDDELQAAMDWACGGGGGADCSKIRVNQACYFPNTLKDHASYAFISYFQRFKHKGGDLATSRHKPTKSEERSM